MGPVFVAFGRVVEYHVENHLDARLVQGPDHLLEFPHLAARLSPRGVTPVRGKEGQRIVSPIIRPLLFVAEAIDVG